MKLISRFCFIILFAITTNASAQEVTKEMRITFLKEFTQTRLKEDIKLLYSAKTDEDKNKYNQQLLADFEQAIRTPYMFDFAFDSVQKDIKILYAPDNKFRIIHWEVEKKDGTFEYYGFIQSKHKQVKKNGLFKKSTEEVIQLYPLIDKSAEIKNPENAVTDNKKWFGMRYYRIIENKTKNKTYYTLLGWDGNDKFSQKKIIDVLTFDNMGVPHFGADIFSYMKRFPKRVIFEYSASCNMPLKYNSKKDSIVFGHLAPTQPQFEGQFQYYCNDMSFDGFGFKKGRWNYGEDVKAVNDKDDNDKLYNDPHDRSPGSDQSDRIEKRKKKKKKKKE